MYLLFDEDGDVSYVYELPDYVEFGSWPKCVEIRMFIDSSIEAFELGADGWKPVAAG